MQKMMAIGNLGHDAEMKYTNSGMPVCNFSLAINTGKDKPPKWIRCAMFGDKAERATPHLTKGSCVYVEGIPDVNAWLSKDTGEARGQLELIVNYWEFAGNKKDRDDSDEPRTRPVERREPDEPLPGTGDELADTLNLDEDVDFF